MRPSPPDAPPAATPWGLRLAAGALFAVAADVVLRLWTADLQALLTTDEAHFLLSVRGVAFVTALLAAHGLVGGVRGLAVAPVPATLSFRERRIRRPPTARGGVTDVLATGFFGGLRVMGSVALLAIAVASLRVGLNGPSMLATFWAVADAGSLLLLLLVVAFPVTLSFVVAGGVAGSAFALVVRLWPGRATLATA